MSEVLEEFIVPGSPSASQAITDTWVKNEPVEISDGEDVHNRSQYSQIYGQLEPNVLLSVTGNANKIDTHNGDFLFRPIITKARKDPIWKYFFTGTDSLGRATCRMCGKEISRGGIGKRSTNSSMKNHLMRKHSSEYKDYLKTKSSVCGEGNVAIEKNIPKTVVRETCSRTNEWPIDDHRSVTYHYLIGEMIALDNLPASFSESVGFRRLLNHSAKLYRVPDKSYFQNIIIPDIYKKCRTKVKSLLSAATCVSFSTVVWSDKYTKEIFLKVSAHWISSDFIFKHFVLDACPLPEMPIEEAVSLKLNMLSSCWDLPSEKVHLAIQDRLVKNSFSCGHCFIKTMESAVQESISSQSSLNDAVLTCRNMAKDICKSPDLYSKLKELQQNHNMDKTLLNHDVDDRWITTYYLLEQILWLQAASSHLNEIQNVIILAEDQCRLIKGAISLLQPCEEITKAISINESVISEVIPTLTTLVCCLNRENVLHNSVLVMKDKLIRFFEGYLCKLCTDQNYTIATFLDPRFKGKFFPEANWEYLRSQLIKEVCAFSSPERLPAKDSEQQTSQLEPSSQCAQISFWDCLSDIKKKKEPESLILESSKAHQQLVVANEVALYLSSPPIAHNENLFIWWKEHHPSFPNLYHLVPKYLSAPASTVFKEKLYCTPGNLYEETKAQQMPRHGEMLAFINCNLSLLNFDYSA